VEDSDLPFGWKSAADPSTGRPYYYNNVTGEVQWEAPSTQVMPQQPQQNQDEELEGMRRLQEQLDAEEEEQKREQEGARKQQDSEKAQKLQEEQKREQEQARKQQESEKAQKLQEEQKREAERKREQARKHEELAQAQAAQKTQPEPGSAAPGPSPSKPPAAAPAASAQAQPTLALPQQQQQKPSSAAGAGASSPSPVATPRSIGSSSSPGAAPIVGSPRVGGLPNGTEFTITLKKEPTNKSLGLMIGNWKKPSSVLVSGIKPGLVKKWNDENPDTMVDKGDIIISVNDKSGYKESLLEISQAEALSVVIIKGGGLASPADT